jgi:hypothetical protein
LIVTDETFAAVPVASGLPAWALMTAATSDPCCSNGIFAAAGVLPLKNVTQACLIWFAAPADAGLGPEAEDGGADATDDGDGPALPAEDDPPQPATSNSTASAASDP